MREEAMNIKATKGFHGIRQVAGQMKTYLRYSKEANIQRIYGRL